MKEIGKLIFFEPQLGEGTLLEFNSQPWAVRIASDAFQQSMQAVSEKLGRQDYLLVQGEKFALITGTQPNIPNNDPIDWLAEELSEAGIAFDKVPCVPKADELNGYWDDGCWWKPLPVGYGFRPKFRCVEIGMLPGIRGESGEIIYRVREYHHAYVGDDIVRTRGNKQERDLFGCCLHALYGPSKGKRDPRQIEEAKTLMRSGYLNWGVKVALKEAYAEMRKDAAATTAV